MDKQIKRMKELSEYSYGDVLNSKTPEELNESSLNVIHKHIQKKNIESWSIQTSWTYKTLKQDNIDNFKKFKEEIRSNGLGYIRLQGYGQELDEDGKEIVTKEPSLFIPKITLEVAKRLMDKYDQYGIIYSGPEYGGKLVLLYSDGETEDMGDFHPMKIAEFYSKLKGKPFTFELDPGNNIERLAKSIKESKDVK